MANYAVKANDTRGRIGKKLEPRSVTNVARELSDDDLKNSKTKVKVAAEAYKKTRVKKKINNALDERRKQYENAFGR